MKSSFRRVAGFLCTIAIAPALPAQEDPTQESSRANRSFTIGRWFNPQLEWTGGFAPKVRLTALPTQPFALTTTITEAGYGVFVTETTPHPDVLLCGRDSASGDGVLELHRWDGAQYSIPSGGSYRVPGSDFTGVAWMPQFSSLFLLDAVQQQVLIGGYTAGGALPTAWGVYAGVGAIPELADADKMVLETGSQTVSPSDLLITQYGKYAGDQVRIPLGSTGLPTKVLGFLDHWARLDTRQLIVGDSLVTVEGPANTQVDVMRLTGSGAPVSIGSVVTDGAGQGTVSLSEPLAALEVYGAKVLGFPSATPPFGSPSHREGAVESINTETTIRPLHEGLTLSAYLGNDHFQVPVWLDPLDPGQGHTVGTIPAFLIAGVASQVVTLPPPDNRTFLASPVSVPVNAEIYAADEPGIAVVKIPLNDDPALAGGEVYFQWLFVVGNQAKLSDIVGVTLRPDAWEPPDGLIRAQGNDNSGITEAPPARGEAFKVKLFALLKQRGFSVHDDRWMRIVNALLRR